MKTPKRIRNGWKCSLCQGYIFHTITCPEYSPEELRKEAEWAHEQMLKHKQWAAEARHRAIQWEGKYRIVCHENNQLRKKLKREGRL